MRGALLGAVRLVAGAYAEWRGCEPSDRQRIYFANHASHLDTLAILAALPRPMRKTVRPVAARDFWDRGALRRFVAVECLNAILVDRAYGAARSGLDTILSALDAGQSLIVFPEGTRGEGEVRAFRAGLYRLARQFPGIELMPVHLDNLWRTLPKRSWLIVPLICTVRFGAPLCLAEGEGKAAFLDRARAALADAPPALA